MPVKSKLRLVTPTIENRAVVPRRPKNVELRRREHLTPTEVERMIEAAKNNHVLRGRHHDFGRLPAWPTCRRGLQPSNGARSTSLWPRSMSGG